jgi:restriction system protein
MVGVVMGLPFIGIGCMAAWRQLQAPSSARIERTLAAVRAMSWNDFASALEDAYRRDGYVVSRVDGAGADFELKKDWRTLLVSGKRWKVARTGVEPLRDLHAARVARDAHACLYVVTGDVTDNARQFADDHKITLVGGAELARLMPAAGRRA